MNPGLSHFGCDSTGTGKPRILLGDVVSNELPLRNFSNPDLPGRFVSIFCSVLPLSFISVIIHPCSKILSIPARWEFGTDTPKRLRLVVITRALYCRLPGPDR